jgi:hypothetical protein
MIENTGKYVVLAGLVSALALGTAYGQSSQNQQDQKTQQTQQSQQSQQTQQSQNQDDQYTGVSHPPPDSSIDANEMPAPPAPAPVAKPSPAIPATPASTPATQPSAGTAPAQAKAAQAANPDDGIVTSVPAASAGGNAANGEQDNNPDGYGIVTSVPPANDSAAATTPDGWNANEAIVNVVPVDPNALGPGTNISVRLKQALSTDSTETGATFRAEVTENIYNGSQLVIPAGSEMRGTVVHIAHGHHLINRANIMLRPDMIVLPDGTAYHLYATAVESFAPGTDVNDEGAIVASHHFAKDAVEYGAGAGAGAAAGGVIAGPVGAGAGAVVGTGLVGTHMLRQPTQAAELPKGSMLIFSLTEPMPLTPTKN